MKEQFIKIYGTILCYGMDVLAAALIFFIGKWLAKILADFAETLMKKAKMDLTLVSFAKHIIYYGLLVFIITSALNKLGVQTTSIIAVIGAAGLAVGLALQGSLSNFAAGVLIILFRPFGIGDSIEAGGASGVVEEIQIFNTILRGNNNTKIILPNSKVTSDKIVVALKEVREYTSVETKVKE